MDAGITFTELLDYTEQETSRWKAWFAAHPQALDESCDVAAAGTVRTLVLHIFATELFFANTVLDLPMPEWQKLPSQTVEELFAVGEDAQAKLREFIGKAEPADWQPVIELGVADLRGSKRKLVAQALLHGVHHRGQLATFLRQRGFADGWVHDLIVTDAMR